MPLRAGGSVGIDAARVRASIERRIFLEPGQKQNFIYDQSFRRVLDARAVFIVLMER